MEAAKQDVQCGVLSAGREGREGMEPTPFMREGIHGDHSQGCPWSRTHLGRLPSSSTAIEAAV